MIILSLTFYVKDIKNIKNIKNKLKIVFEYFALI